jgi:type IX secretion system PorP/SprF family membrane protein
MNEFGLGVQILNDSYGNTRKTGLGLTYAYHLDLGNAGYLSSGLTPKFYQFSINQENYFYFDNNDDVISNAKEGKMVFDIDFGLYFYNDNYYAGFSALNLLESNLNFGSNNSDDNRMLRDFLIMGGYNLSLTDNIEITPSFLAGFNSAASYIDIGAKALIKDMIWAGLSYKSINTLSFMAGVKYQKYYLGYAFDYSMNDISKYTSGTHEILMGINFGKIQNTARL